MAKGHVRPGLVMPWTNATGTDVAAGEVVVFAAMIGVALGNIANGGTGELAIAEVWELPKTADLAIDQGAAVYWSTDGAITVTNTDTPAGLAYAPALKTDTVVRVLVNGR